MAYEIRPLATLSSLARNAFVQSVTGAFVRLWANTFTVFGKVFALLDFEHEQRRAYLYRQLFASTADLQWLVRHGYELGLSIDPGSASAGTMSATVPGGTAVPAGLSYARGDGRTYSTLAAVSAPGTANSLVAVDLPVMADLAGAEGDMAGGDLLTLQNPGSGPFGLAPTATVDAAGLTGGTEPEDVETFRARVLFRKRNPPQGGSAPDYVKWVGEALSTLQVDDQSVGVYVDSFANDSRTVWVCFTVSDQPSGIPSDGELAAVQAYISDPVRRPVTARVYAVKPTPMPQAIGIQHLSPDTPDIRAAIAAELGAYVGDDWTIGPVTLTANSMPVNLTGAEVMGLFYARDVLEPVATLTETEVPGTGGLAVATDRTTGVLTEAWVASALTATVKPQDRADTHFPTRLVFVVTDSRGRERTYLIVLFRPLERRTDTPPT